MTSSRRRLKRLILHAGLPKTATTSIQQALFESRDILLSKASMHYPGSDANHTNQLCTAFLKDPRKHISNKVSGLTDLEGLRELASNIRNSLRSEILQSEAETIVFSAEGMSNLDIEELESFREWAETFVEQVDVFYVTRNPIDYSASVTQQHLKGGQVLEDIYKNPPTANFQGRLKNAIVAFGREAVSAFTFEEMVAHKDGVCGLILDRLGVSDEDVRKSVLSHQSVFNESLSNEAAHILSSLNLQRPAFIDGHRAERRTLSEVQVLAQIKGRKFHLPRWVEEKVLELSVEDIAWLEGEFSIARYSGLSVETTELEVGGFSSETVDSLAIVLSDLLNEKRTTALLRRAHQLRASADVGGLKGLLRDVMRISPDCAIPPVLQEYLP